MKRLALLACVAVLSSACSPLLFGPYGQARRPYYPQSPYAARVEPLPTGRWDNVMRLARHTTIDVLTQDGAAPVGAFTGASATQVRLMVRGNEVTIERAEVVRVDLVALAGSSVIDVANETAKGALIGAGVAALAGAVVGGGAWPPPAPLLRGGAAVGGLAGAQSELARRQQRMIYLAPEIGAARRGGD